MVPTGKAIFINLNVVFSLSERFISLLFDFELTIKAPLNVIVICIRFSNAICSSVSIFEHSMRISQEFLSIMLINPRLVKEINPITGKLYMIE